MRHTFSARARALLLALLLPSAVFAAAPTGYIGQAPVNSQSDEERVGALQTALANVVVAQTGDSGILARPDVAKAVAQAERYVLQYQYKPNTGDDGAKLVLVVQFDSVAVDKLMARLGVGAQTDAAALSETPSDAVVWVGGIRDANDYARVVGYLARSNFVRAAVPLQARGESLQLKLSLATDLAHFLDAVGMERTLVVDTSAHTDGVDATLMLGH